MKKPDFLIIGVQRGGTSSLYRYLMEHSQIAAPVDKELQFFTFNFHRGWDWYISQFPSFEDNRDGTISADKKIITGEASPYYIFHPLTPERVKKWCPEIKLIVLLRDPVARAISHYHHCIRFRLESLPIEEAFAQEFSRLAQETEKLKADPEYYSYNHQHLSYLSRGRYMEQLALWRAHFPPEQFLILQSEAFYANPTKILQQVTDFLGISAFELSEYYPHNQAEYPQASASIISNLSKYFETYNQQLYQYLEQEFHLNWPINFEIYHDYYALETKDEQIIHLKLQLQAKITKIEQLNRNLQQENNQLTETRDNLNNQCRIWQQKVQELQAQNQMLKEHIAAMESSKFWKIRKLWFKLTFRNN